MYYVLAPSLRIQVTRFLRRMSQQGKPTKLVFTSRSARSSSLFAMANILPGDAVYYPELGAGQVAIKTVTKPPVQSDWQMVKRSMALTEYLDAKGMVRAKVQYRYDKLWQANIYNQDGRLIQVDYYDVRGFLARRKIAGAQTQYLADGSVRIHTNERTSELIVSDHGKPLGTANSMAGAVARLLDNVYQPGDVVISMWADDFSREVAAQLTQPFGKQIGFEQPAGTLPQPDFMLGQELLAHYETVSRDSERRRAAGEFYYAGSVQKHLEVGREVTTTFLAMKGKQAQEYLRDHIGSAGESFMVKKPAYFNTAINLHVGDNFFANRNVIFMDEGRIDIGDNAKIGPNCGFYTSGHPLNAAVRNGGYGIVKPIKIGHNLWMGGSAVILGGVTLGNNVVIAAGAVVTKSFGDNVLLAGVPARVIRKLDPDEYDV